MDIKRYKPLIDKLFWIISIPTAFLCVGATVISMSAIFAFVLMIFVDLLTLYFIVSPLFGYVELRKGCLFIKFGFFLKKEIEYKKIRGMEIVKKYYSDSLISLKNSYEHVNIMYNRFEIVSISVKDNKKLTEELETLIKSENKNEEGSLNGRI